MAAPRFYVEVETEALDKALAEQAEVVLPPKAAHHAGRALRLRTGEETVVFNGTGRQWRGRIRFDQDGAYVALDAVETPEVEPPVRMTLVQALVSPEKLDWIVEKAVETGVSEIVLTPAARSVTKLAGERLEKRLQKLRDIAVSAAEQCGRNVVPEIRGASSFKEAMLGTQADRRLVLAPGAAHGTRLTGEEKSVAFAVGPEGGFSPEEIDLAEEAGWLAVLLGPRVLRTETAGIAAAVWLNTLTGDYGERLSLAAQVCIAGAGSALGPFGEFGPVRKAQLGGIASPAFRRRLASAVKLYRRIGPAFGRNGKKAVLAHHASSVPSIVLEIGRAAVPLEGAPDVARPADQIGKNVRADHHVRIGIEGGLGASEGIEFRLMHARHDLHQALCARIRPGRRLEARLRSDDGENEQGIKIPGLADLHGPVRDLAGIPHRDTEGSADVFRH